MCPTPTGNGFDAMLPHSGRQQSVASTIKAGEAAAGRGDYAAARSYFSDLAEDGDAAVSAEGHFRLGMLAWREHNFDGAEAHYRRCGELSRKGHRPNLDARSENAIGAVHYARGDYVQARAAYLSALERTEDPVLHGLVLMNLGVLANIEADLDRALELYLRARALFRDHGSPASEALALHNLQTLHADRREWDEAEEVSVEALKVLERVGDRATMADVLRDRSELFAAKGDFARAVRECQLAIAIYTELGNELGRGETQRLQGRFLRELNDVRAAEKCLMDAFHIARTFRAKLLEAEASRELAALKRRLGDAAEATRWRLQALKLFRDLGAQPEVAQLERNED